MRAASSTRTSGTFSGSKQSETASSLGAQRLGHGSGADDVHDSLFQGTQLRFLDAIEGTHPRQTFDSKVLQMSPEEVNRYWIDQKIRGVQPPPAVDAGAAVEILKKVPAAIAYLPGSAATGLRKVSIEGNPHWLG